MRDAIGHRQHDREAMRLRLDRRRRELYDERAAITKAAISGAIAPETSREQLDRNRVEDESRVLTDPAGLWKEARGNARLALQSFVFPEGVTFDGQSFGAVVTLRSAAYARGNARRGRW